MSNEKLEAGRVRVKALYITGDGGIWKLNREAMAKVAAGASWLDVGRPLSAKMNYRTGKWRALPAPLYQHEDGIGSARTAYPLISYDYHDEILETCKEASADAEGQEVSDE
jgi:hypothetical protein